MKTKVKQINLNSGVFLLVEMPGDAIRFRVENGLLIWTTSLYEKTKQAEDDKWEVLPLLEITEEWEIIGKGNEITGAMICEILDTHFTMKTHDKFIELLKSHGMKPETTLILKLK